MRSGGQSPAHGRRAAPGVAHRGRRLGAPDRRGTRCGDRGGSAQRDIRTVSFRRDADRRGVVRLRDLPRRGLVDLAGGAGEPPRAHRARAERSRRRLRDLQRSAWVVRPPGRARLAPFRRFCARSPRRRGRCLDRVAGRSAVAGARRRSTPARGRGASPRGDGPRLRDARVSRGGASPASRERLPRRSLCEGPLLPGRRHPVDDGAGAPPGRSARARAGARPDRRAAARRFRPVHGLPAGAARARRRGPRGAAVGSGARTPARSVGCESRAVSAATAPRTLRFGRSRSRREGSSFRSRIRRPAAPSTSLRERRRGRSSSRISRVAACHPARPRPRSTPFLRRSSTSGSRAERSIYTTTNRPWPRWQGSAL